MHVHPRIPLRASDRRAHLLRLHQSPRESVVRYSVPWCWDGCGHVGIGGFAVARPFLTSARGGWWSSGCRSAMLCERDAMCDIRVRVLVVFRVVSRNAPSNLGYVISSQARTPPGLDALWRLPAPVFHLVPRAFLHACFVFGIGPFCITRHLNPSMPLIHAFNGAEASSWDQISLLRLCPAVFISRPLPTSSVVNLRARDFTPSITPPLATRIASCLTGSGNRCMIFVSLCHAGDTRPSSSDDGRGSRAPIRGSLLGSETVSRTGLPDAVRLLVCSYSSL